MKKALCWLFLVLLLPLSSPPAYAAPIQIKVDGVAVPSDAKPEIKNNRTMAPLRVISENLGASVEWSGSEAILSKNDMKVVLKLNGGAAEKNGEKIPLEAKPYLQQDRIFIPLRFIAETFGCSVDYDGSTVTVDTEPLVVDGVKASALLEEYHMTMGGIVQRMGGNAHIESVYRLFAENKGEKVEAPEHYSWMYTIDTLGSYYKNAQYDFLDPTGSSFVRYDVYSLIRTFPPELLTGHPEYLIHDVSKDEWYLFNEAAAQAVRQAIDAASRNGFLTIVSNTVV